MGLGAGESKRAQLEEKGTPQIDENGLLTMIRSKRVALECRNPDLQRLISHSFIDSHVPLPILVALS